MSEKRRKGIVFAVLILAIIWGIWNNPFAPRRPAAEADEPGWSDPDPSARSAELEVVPDTRLAVIVGWQDDPFARGRVVKSAVKTAVAELPLKLSAISSAAGSYMAVINGKVVKEQDTIESWTVTTIDAESVLLTKGASSLRLQLKRG